MRKPTSTRETLNRLCANHPASTSNAIDSAICAVVSVARKRAAALPPVCRTPLVCSAGFVSTRTSFSAGINPNTSVDPSASAAVKAAIEASSVRSIVCEEAGSILPMPRSAPRVSGKLTSAAAAASKSTSTSNNASSRGREAPSEARTAISPMRVDPRASIKFATFTLAINSTSTVETSRIVSGVARVVVDSALPALSGREHERLGAKPFDFLLGEVREQRRIDFVEDGPIRPVDRRGRLLERNAGLQAREQIRPVALAIVMVGEGSLAAEPTERDRHEHLRPRTDRRAVEVLRPDADDRQRLAIDDERTADDARVRAERRLPIGVAQHDGARLAFDAIVAGVEQAAGERAKTEQRKIAAGHEHPFGRNGVAVEREVGVHDAVRGDTDEGPIDAFEIAEHREAKDLLLRAAVVGRRAALFRARRREIHELVRVRHSQLAQQYLIVDREDRRVDAEPQSQRHDDDDGEERPPREAAQAVANVAE